MNTTTLTRTNGTASPTAWRLRAWNDAVLEERFMRESLISISADEIGDVTAWPGDEEMRHRLRAGTIGRGEQAIGMFVRYWDDFRNQMKPGDVVVVPLLGRRAAIGLITGDYEYRAMEEEPKMRHVRKVRWLRTVERSVLDDGIRKVVNAPGTICRINASGAADRLLG
jgi:restriction system protein